MHPRVFHPWTHLSSDATSMCLDDIVSAVRFYRNHHNPSEDGTKVTSIRIAERHLVVLLEALSDHSRREFYERLGD